HGASSGRSTSLTPRCFSGSALKIVFVLNPPTMVSAPDPSAPTLAAISVRAPAIHCGARSTVMLTATHATDDINAHAPKRDHHSRFSSDISALASPTKMVAASANDRMNTGGAKVA